MCIDILGVARIRPSGGEPIELPPARGAVLIRLLLAEAQEVPQQRLRQLLPNDGGEQAVQKHVSDLRAQLKRYGVQVPPMKRHAGTYHLPLDGIAVDAFQFRDGVAGLADPPAGDEIDALLKLWRGNPRAVHPNVPSRLWRNVFDARDRLLSVVAGSAATRLTPGQWWRFADLFPADEKVDQVTSLLAPEKDRTADPVPRLLIVEDRIGDDLRDRLAPYACTVITSSKCWFAFLATTGGKLDFAVALVDLHLNEESDDYGGLDVLAYLRDHVPRIPTVLLTAYTTPGIVDDMKEKYRIDLIVHKDPSGSVADVREAVSRLLRLR